MCPRRVASWFRSVSRTVDASRQHFGRHAQSGMGVAREAPRPFLVLEYCDQGSLAGRVTTRRPWPWVAAALAHVAAGLAPLHARRGFHRDVKPGNLLVKLDRAHGFLVKVADYGLARRPETDPSGMTNTPGGTPGYMAPDVTCTPFDSRADVYSLGVVALELLTGVCNVERLGASAPPELVALVRRMLAIDPAQRPTAEKIRAVLVDLVERECPPIEPSAIEPAGPTLMEAVFGGLAIGAVVLGAAAALPSRHRATRVAEPARGRLDRTPRWAPSATCELWKHAPPRALAMSLRRGRAAWACPQSRAGLLCLLALDRSGFSAAWQAAEGSSGQESTRLRRRCSLDDVQRGVQLREHPG